MWPENYPAYHLFREIERQWNVGVNGCTGLRYEALYPLLDRRAKSPQEWELLFADVRVIEAAALTAMRTKR